MMLHAHAIALAALVPAVSPQTAAQTPPRLTFPPCADAVQDQAGGGCLEASSVPTLGRLHPLSSDFFIQAGTGFVGLGTTNPVATLDIRGGGLHLDGNLTLQDANDSIRFPNSPGFNQPMIEMFDDQANNGDRMVLAHSEGVPQLGLKYQDVGDRFVFQNGNTQPVFTVDLLTENATLHDGGLTILNTKANRSLDVSNVSPSLNQVANIERFSFSQGGNDILQLRVPFGSSPQSQYIEAEDNTQIYFRVDLSGSVYADGAYTGPADFAEMIQVTWGADSVEPGDVLVIDATSSRGVQRSASARSTLVAGVYSTNPGFVGSERQWEEPGPASAPTTQSERRTFDRSDMARLYDEIPMAMVGIVPCKVSAENGPIRPGDLLVTSSTAGHAMRDDDPRTGTVVGKALESLAMGTGVIRVLVTLQ